MERYLNIWISEFSFIQIHLWWSYITFSLLLGNKRIKRIERIKREYLKSRHTINVNNYQFRIIINEEVGGADIQEIHKVNITKEKSSLEYLKGFQPNCLSQKSTGYNKTIIDSIIDLFSWLFENLYTHESFVLADALLVMWT